MSRATYLPSVREDARKLAMRVFAEHEVKQENENQWLFIRPKGRPHHWAYWMRILRAPGMLMAYGDAGEVFFRPNDANAMLWLERQLLPRQRYDYDLTYIAEKVPGRVGIEDFQPALITRYLDEVAEEAQRALEEDQFDSWAEKEKQFVDGVRARHFDHEHAFYEAWYEKREVMRLHTDDPPSVCGLTFQFIFQVEMFRYFFHRLRTGEPLRPVEATTK